jgi:hypothetical protein
MRIHNVRHTLSSSFSATDEPYLAKDLIAYDADDLLY